METQCFNAKCDNYANKGQITQQLYKKEAI